MFLTELEDIATHYALFEVHLPLGKNTIKAAVKFIKSCNYWTVIYFKLFVFFPYIKGKRWPVLVHMEIHLVNTVIEVFTRKFCKSVFIQFNNFLRYLACR